MRRISILILAVLTVFSLALSVSADTGASKVTVFATASQNGDCQVTMNVTLLLESPVQELTFPVPAGATGVTLNGSRARMKKSGDALLIDLSNHLGGMAGEFSFSINYTLHRVVSIGAAGTPELTLTLLSGFAYPVQLLECSLTLPGQVSQKPAFSSGYYQATIEQSLSYSISGATVNVQSQRSLKDHETLVMTLSVPEDMFITTAQRLDDTLFYGVAMGVCAFLAFVYWLIFLRSAPLRRQKTVTPPEGCSAGEIGSALTLQAADLNLMVFSWAQLGYLTIRMDRHGKVGLTKRMDMGNERGAFEQRCFRSLFSGKATVDTGSLRYAALCKKVEKMPPNIQALVRPRSGNPRLLRALCSGISLFGGSAVGAALSYGSALSGFWAVVLAILGGVCGWYIQRWAKNMLLRDKTGMLVAFGLCAAILLLSILSGYLWIGAVMAVSQLLGGLMAYYGGRRTEEGRYDAGLVLGLRKYLRTVSREEIRRIQELDPDYFHEMAPYALALGVDKRFARQFGTQTIDACPYLVLPTDTPRSAAKWSAIMRRTLQAMERRKKQLPMENLMKLIGSIRR